MGIIRAESIARARKSIKEGVSAYRWIADMRELGLTYRRTDMLADYRNVLHLEEKKDLLRYVRKDRYPTEKIYATTTWDLSKEFQYVVKIKTQLRPDEPVTEHTVSIQVDAPMTPAMIEAKVIEERAKEERYLGEMLVLVEPFLAVRRVRE